MSTLTESRFATERPEPAGEQPAAGAGCERCGAPLERDQEWCHECGTARTVIRRSAGWRVPVVVVGTVLLLVLAGFAIALIDLSSEANRSASSSASSGAAAKAPAPPAPSKRAPKAVTHPETWPAQLQAWTVVLAARRSFAAAQTARTDLAKGGLALGLIDSSRHSSLKPGWWLVYTGRYDSASAALARVDQLLPHGYAARVRLVTKAS